MRRIFSVSNGLGFLAVFLLGFAATPQAVSADFVPHRAAYTLSLDPRGADRDVAGARGRVVVDWQNACEGWTFNYRSVLEVTYAGAPPVRLGVRATTWESADGRDYRFDVTHTVNGKKSDRFAGEAVFDGPDSTGRVAYTHPKDRKPVTLRKGTVFPLAHTKLVMDSARSAKGFPVIVTREIFDGMDEDDVFTATAVIGRSERGAKDGHEPLAGMQAWPMSVAYFRDKDKSDAPYYEYSIRVYANGVGDRLRISLKDLRLRGTLDQLDIHKNPDCGASR